MLEPLLECNEMVVTWLQNAMSLEIKNGVVYIEIAHALWLELEQRLHKTMDPEFLS